MLQVGERGVAVLRVRHTCRQFFCVKALLWRCGGRLAVAAGLRMSDDALFPRLRRFLGKQIALSSADDMQSPEEYIL
jgi:hypothetical protein